MYPNVWWHYYQRLCDGTHHLIWIGQYTSLVFVPTYLHARYFISASTGLSIKIKQKTFSECCVFAAAQRWPSLSRVQRQTFRRDKHPESHPILLWSDSRPGWSTLLRFESGFIFAPVYQPDCSSDPGRSSRLSGVYVLWFWLPESLVSAELCESLPEVKLTDTCAHLYGRWTVKWSRCIDDITFDNHNDEAHLYGTLHN